MSRLLAITVAAVAALASFAPAAGAACPAKPTKQAFAAWLDPMQYTLAEGGAFEGGTPSQWNLGGATVAKENEPFHLNAPRDARSLVIRSGNVATSPATCVGIEHPTVRFMVRSTGSALGLLTVHALVPDAGGVLDVVPMGVVTGLTGPAWRPSLPMVLTSGLAGSLLDGSTQVRFRFTAVGLGAAFQIDDVFVDPYKRG